MIGSRIPSQKRWGRLRTSSVRSNSTTYTVTVIRGVDISRNSVVIRGADVQGTALKYTFENILRGTAEVDYFPETVH